MKEPWAVRGWRQAPVTVGRSLTEKVPGGRPDWDGAAAQAEGLESPHSGTQGILSRAPQALKGSIAKHVGKKGRPQFHVRGLV